MRRFTDSKGDEWSIQVTLATAKRLRSESRDLLDVNRVAAMLGDPIELFDLLYLICEPQAKERSVSDEQFGERLSGVSESAVEQLMEELRDFFQQVGRPMMAATVTRVWTATKTQQETATDLMNSEKATKAIQASILSARQEAERGLDRLIGVTSTN